MEAERSVADQLPEEGTRREAAMGRFTARFAMGLPETWRVVAFCSPASFRDPEADNVWHPFMIRNGFTALVKDQIPMMFRAIAGGLRRFLTKRFGSYRVIDKRNASILGICPATLCRVQGDRVATTYCTPEDAEHISWLIFDESQTQRRPYPISRIRILFRWGTMLSAWWHATRERNRAPGAQADDIAASLLVLRWIFGFSWVNKLMLAYHLDYQLSIRAFDRIYCVHEMHPHSRIVWGIAEERNTGSVTVQHASIARSKLWYFPTTEEIAGGLKTPREWAVYCRRTRDLMAAFLPGETRYRFVCGPRYAHWKDVSPVKITPTEMAPVLFAGSLPWWDNVVVLEAAKKLLDSPPGGRTVQVRLHPAAILPKRWKQWLDQMTRQNRLSISTGDLSDAVGDATVVVGMNTTVLEEASLTGKAVIVLSSDDYLSFSNNLGTNVPVRRFSWETIEETISTTESRFEDSVARGREQLGIDRTVFSFEDLPGGEEWHPEI